MGGSSLKPDEAPAEGSLFAEDDLISAESLIDGDAIENLLASLSNDNAPEFADTTINSNHEPDIGRNETRELLSNAYGFIQGSSAAVAKPGGDMHGDSPDFLKADYINNNDDEDDESDEEKVEAEAAKYVEDLLKEIQKNPPPASPTKDHIVDSPTSNNTNDDENDLENRLAALSLPSAPKSRPGASRKEDDEAPKCCCICYDTPKLECMDCEGDRLFCVRCWWEMHSGDGSDTDHKAVKYETPS